VHGWLTIEAGGRVDGSTVAETAWSPRLALIATPRPQTTLKLIGGAAFRAPSAYEREFWADGHKRATGLGPERVRTAELVWTERLSRAVAATVSAYRSHITDLIDTRTDAFDGNAYFANVEHVHASAVEMELNATFSGDRTAFLSYGLMRARSHNDAHTHDERMSNSPGQSVKAGATSPLAGGLTGALLGRYEDRRRTIYGTSTAAAWIVDTQLRWAHAHGGLRAELRVRNLFDADWSTPGGYEHVPAQIPPDGRTLRVGLGYVV
jgi:iron complex outermembrane receptor protein